jgi:segregation and condensation protein A
VVNADYTVRLERLFHGPMDLLLHLVREQEVDIHEIEINRVIDGYLAYLKALEAIDIELAGDFLVLAATLMSIKSRSLLPREDVDLEQELDPRDELIQRLIEYRRFKDASRDLAERFDLRSKLYPRSSRAGSAASEEPTLDFGDITQWDLLSAFSRLMRETLSHRALKIASDSRPLRWYVERLVGWIKEKKSFSMRELVAQSASEEEASKPLLIGTFCALLELMKLGVVSAHQADPHGDIHIALREEFEQDLDDIVRLSGFDDELGETELTPRAPPRGVGSAQEPGSSDEEEASLEFDASIGERAEKESASEAGTPAEEPENLG